MNPMRKPWSDLMKDILSQVYDEFTAVRMHNQLMEEYDVIHATAKSNRDFIERWIEAFHSKLPTGYERKAKQMKGLIMRLLDTEETPCS